MILLDIHGFTLLISKSNVKLIFPRFLKMVRVKSVQCDNGGDYGFKRGFYWSWHRINKMIWWGENIGIYLSWASLCWLSVLTLFLSITIFLSLSLYITSCLSFHLLSFAFFWNYKWLSFCLSWHIFSFASFWHYYWLFFSVIFISTCLSFSAYEYSSYGYSSQTCMGFSSLEFFSVIYQLLDLILFLRHYKFLNGKMPWLLSTMFLCIIRLGLWSLTLQIWIW